jgi:hypothetical protein
MKAILVILLLNSCASLESSVPLEKRKYDLCVTSDGVPTCDGFCYQDDVCTKRFLGICTKREIKVVEKIKMTMDNRECERLFNSNFILQVRDLPI